MKHWPQVAYHLEAQPMGVEKRHFVGAVDVKRLAVIYAVAGNNGRARPAFTIKKNVRVLASSKSWQKISADKDYLEL